MTAARTTARTTPALGRLTAAKVVANTALRWIPPFLPTLEMAFGASTTQLTTIIGIGEGTGLSTIAVGHHLDRRRERVVMIGGLLAISASAVVALIGTIPSFAVSYAMLICGVANFTVAGHAWISHRVDYRWRARSIGFFETSWALALLVGAPVVAILINVYGWRGPFVALAVASALAAAGLAVTLRVDRGEPDGAGDDPSPGRVDSALPARAWLVIVGSATMAMSGLSVFVVSGSWLDDAFGVSTGGLGAIAMTFGAVELIASSSTAAFADRLGKQRSTIAGLCSQAIGLTIMVGAGDRLAVGVVGLLLFLLGFEFGFVTSLSLVSEAVPHARGRTLATSNAVGTVARGAGTIASGWLYGTHGITGTAALSAGGVTVALLAFVLSARVGAGRS